MGSERAAVTPIPAPRTAVPAAAALFALCACGGGSAPDGALPVPPPLADLDARTRLSVRPFPRAGQPALDRRSADALIIGGEGWRVPAVEPDPAVLAAVRAFAREGGRVLLLGYAAALVQGLGLEERAPDLAPFRWGFDARTAQGRAQLGFQVVTGRAPELFAGLVPAPGREHAYFVTGGEPCCVPLCTWSAGPPAHGEVLGQLVRQCDGEGALLPAAVLVRWSLGAGAVLALGLEPDVRADDPVLASNARTLFGHALHWLGGAAPPRRLQYWLLPDPAPPPPPDALPPLAGREVPGAPLLAHWGFVADVHDAEPPRRPAEMVDSVLLSAWRAGADVLALDLVEPSRGLPVPWGERDPLLRPDGYRGGAFAEGWHPESIGELAAEAHARGLLVQALLDPPPGGSLPAERLAALRFVARELFDQRRLGERALDGVAVREWFPDPGGLALAMLQDFRPAGHLARAGEGAAPLAGALGALDADDGRPLGLRAYGIAGGFRDGFPADLYPLGYLDCAARRPVPAAPAAAPETGSGAGGGSFGDWIALQAQDFVRARRGLGGAMLWRAHDRATLGPDTEAYVHGVSLEPLVAAVAARCSATGVDGWRDAQRALLPAVQHGFGRELPVPAATVVLQNNHFRLHGSGGSLVFDATGLARFGPGLGTVLAGAFFRTRLFGGRPDAGELRAADRDLLAVGRRGEGGYAATTLVAEGDVVPSVLAFGAAPRWPQRIDLPLGAGTGWFELELEARALNGSGVLAVGLDDAALAFLPFEDGRLAIYRSLPVHVATEAGPRWLRLEVVDGGALAIDRLRLHRRGDVAAEAQVLVPAGSIAAVRESSASTYHAETVTLFALADFPGLLLQASCERAARSLQQERRFGLRHHRTLRTSLGGGADDLREPFVLAADDPALPDLAVVPLALARYEHFELREGELVLKCQPEPGTVSRIGFCLLPRAEMERMLPHLGSVFAALDRPAVLELGDRGLGELPAELPVAWTRPLRVRQQAPTPFLVRERGWWTWRGTQRLPDGDYLLRIAQFPDDVVQIVGGQALFGRTRPGTGALRTVALRDPQPDAVTVRVLQPSPLAMPSVILADDFDEAFLDGAPWAFRDGRTVFLPADPGTYRVTTRRHGGAPVPHVVASGAPLSHCAWDGAARELVLVAHPRDGWPADLPLTAVVAGPEPTTVEGGEVVPERDLRYGSREAAHAAAARGVVLRFRPGIVRVRYGG